MKLPSDEVGISDILQWRDCPQRFAFGMQRHTGQEAPEATNETNAYGTAIHDAIYFVEGGLPNQDAVSETWKVNGKWLDPEDLQMLADDLDKYSRDAPLGMKLVGSEMEGRVPLFAHEGRTIFFRFRLDALYQRVGEPGVFYHRDYKSSKWKKSQAEVDEDEQMWAYNFAIHELYPECRSLLQSYEQLKFGNLLTSKNDDQRVQMKAWLIENVKAILADDTLAPKQNQWCPWCPLVVTCDVTARSTTYWKGVLGTLAPLTKEGRKTRVAFLDEGAQVEEMVKMLPRMMQTRKHLEHVEKALKGLLEKMPAEERARLGWRLGERKTSELPPAALRVLHEALGDSFFEAVTVSRSRLEKIAGKSELELARELELEKVSTITVLPS